MMKKLSIFLLAGLGLAACQPSAEKEQASSIIDQQATQRLDEVLQAFVSDSIVAGASALIFEKGEEVYFNAYGHADREAGTPMARNTIATIYSMTKPITGVTLMSLYEQGKFQLEDSLASYLPEYADMQVATLDEEGNRQLVPADRAITIADITRHTAGFSSRSDLGLDTLAGAAQLLALDKSLSDMSAALSELPLGYQPGTRWEYGISVDVQARLAEKLSGQPFPELMQQVVLGPLKM